MGLQADSGCNHGSGSVGLQALIPGAAHDRRRGRAGDPARRDGGRRRVRCSTRRLAGAAGGSARPPDRGRGDRDGRDHPRPGRHPARLCHAHGGPVFRPGRRHGRGPAVADGPVAPPGVGPAGGGARPGLCRRGPGASHRRDRPDRHARRRGNRPGHARPGGSVRGQGINRGIRGHGRRAAGRVPHSRLRARAVHRARRDRHRARASGGR